MKFVASSLEIVAHDPDVLCRICGNVIPSDHHYYSIISDHHVPQSSRDNHVSQTGFIPLVAVGTTVWFVDHRSRAATLGCIAGASTPAIANDSFRVGELR